MNNFHIFYYLLPSGLSLFSAIPETDWLLDSTDFKATFEELEGPPKTLRQSGGNLRVDHVLKFF